MRAWWWLLGLVLVASAVEAFVLKLHDAGVLAALERWRQRPRAVIITVAELAALLTVAGLFTTTSGWAAVAWFAAGLGVAALLVWTTHLILRAGVPEAPAAPKAPAASAARPAAVKPQTAGAAPLRSLGYAWVLVPGYQILMHAVPVTDGVPGPRAYCGYEYDPDDVAGPPVIWLPEHNPRSQTCPTCRTATAGTSFIKP
jgi:hypothetical protein